MIDFKLYEKNDYLVLMDSFELLFLQIPIKHSAKAIQKYLPNGFRPESLSKGQLNTMYVEALFNKEPNIVAFFLDEIQRNFEANEIDDYFNNREKSLENISSSIIELSSIVFEKHMFIPAHLILMLYGYECSTKEKENSLKLHNIFSKEKNDTGEKAYEKGFNKAKEESEKKFANEIKKITKLQKKVESLEKKTKEYEKTNKLILEENSKIKTKLDLEETKNVSNDEIINNLEQKEKHSQERIMRLIVELEDKKKELEVLEGEIKTITSSCETTEYVDIDLNQVCKDAIDMFYSNDYNRNMILNKAKEVFQKGENLIDGWCKCQYLNVQKMENIFVQFYSSV